MVGESNQKPIACTSGRLSLKDGWTADLGPETPAAAPTSTRIRTGTDEETQFVVNGEPTQTSHQDGADALDVSSPKKEMLPLEEEFHLQEDIFSLLFLSPVRSQAFLYSMFWMAFQAGIITLIACKYNIEYCKPVFVDFSRSYEESTSATIRCIKR